MKCENCIYHKNCQFIASHKFAYIHGQISGCTAFEDKSNYVQVVRCKDCKHFEQMYDLRNGWKLHFGLCLLKTNHRHDEQVNCDYFCGDGEKR